MKWLVNNFWWVLFFFVTTVIFYPFILFGKLPIPSDALVGLYHPWRDALSSTYPNGYPYKNPLITDPVRQQYPYRVFAVSSIKQGQFPVWNPYSFSGTPLFANIQAAVFYPFNLVFWVFNDPIAWSVLVFLQPVFAGIFLYAYLRFFKVSKIACFFAAVSFAFSGFMVAWMEWNTIGHAASWLPLILLAKEKILFNRTWKWIAVLIFAETSAIFAGHLQTALYVIIFSSVYLLLRVWQLKKFDSLKIFAITGFTVLLITSIQLIPTANFLLNSARESDLSDWKRNDWFIPPAHLVQFIAPDYFGNPATGNYWGVWNYGEFVGYAGIGAILFSIYAIFFRRDKKTKFFLGVLIISFVFALPTVIGKLPYIFQFPFIKTMQPSRLLFIINFCLAVLSGLGLDMVLYHFRKIPKSIINRNYLFVTLSTSLLFIGLWLVTLVYKGNNLLELEVYRQIALRNILLPSILFGVSVFCIGCMVFVNLKIVRNLAVSLFFIIFLFDIFRFTHKFIPFTDKTLLFPETKTLEFLQVNSGYNRIMTTDRRLLTPNTSIIYNLQSIDGYDPLYLNIYANIVAAWTRDKPDISPASFNRILTPEKIDSFFTDLMGVKFILSLNELTDSKYVLRFSEGQTKIYENMHVYPRVFLLEEVKILDSPQSVIEQMFHYKNDLIKIGFTSESVRIDPRILDTSEEVIISHYSPNMIKLHVNTITDRILVLTDVNYDSWHATVDNESKEILTIDYMFRGVKVPSGSHVVIFETRIW